METPVKITATKDGSIVGVSVNNPEYGYVRVEQTVREINASGWLSFVKRSALLKGKVDDLVKANFQEGEVLPGKIIIKESLVPFDPTNPDKNLKIAGETGVICRVDDQPIYRQTFYTTNLDATDELISHTNSQEIKEVLAAQKAVSSLASRFKLPEGATL